MKGQSEAGLRTSKGRGRPLSPLAIIRPDKMETQTAEEMGFAVAKQVHPKRG